MQEVHRAGLGVWLLGETLQRCLLILGLNDVLQEQGIGVRRIGGDLDIQRSGDAVMRLQFPETCAER